jgi:hypothetical protein
MVTRGFDLLDLVGEELSGVCFVRDYVELHFDGPILRVLAAPKITIGEITASFPEPTSRDLLCGLIGAEVANTVEGASVLVVEFSGGRGTVEVPLRSGGVLVEVAHLVPERDGRLDPSGMSIWESRD